MIPVRARINFRRLLLATLMAAAGSGLSHAATGDPVCSIEIDGVSALSTTDQAQQAWAGPGLAAHREQQQRVAQAPKLTLLRVNSNPSSPDAATWGPVRYSHSSPDNGAVTVSRSETDTARIVRRTGERVEAWRRMAFAARVSAITGRHCDQGNPRVKCQFEGTQLRQLSIGPPADGTLPYCTYRVSLQMRGGKVYRSVVGESESDALGSLDEQLSLVVTPTKDQVRSGRGG